MSSRTGEAVLFVLGVVGVGGFTVLGVLTVGGSEDVGTGVMDHWATGVMLPAGIMGTDTGTGDSDGNERALLQVGGLLIAGLATAPSPND